MLLALGCGHNASNVVQAMGRATFNGKKVLNKNGFKNVTFLTKRNDLTASVKMNKYIDHVDHRVQQGDDFAAAVTGANVKIPDNAVWLRDTNREVGRIKGVFSYN